jgi:hypothetical protein
MTWPDGPRASDRDRVDLFVPAYQYGGGYEYVNATVAMDLVASGNLASLHLYCSVAHVESDLQNADWGYGGRVTSTRTSTPSPDRCLHRCGLVRGDVVRKSATWFDRRALRRSGC